MRVWKLEPQSTEPYARVAAVSGQPLRLLNLTPIASRARGSGFAARGTRKRFLLYRPTRRSPRRRRAEGWDSPRGNEPSRRRPFGSRCGHSH